MYLLAATTEHLLLIFYLALALGVSFLCSLLEASLLSVSTSHVELMAQEKKRGGELLKQMKTGIDRPLAAILTLNTIAHTIGAAGVGAQILVIWGNSAVAIGSAVVTLLILVLSEIIPKSLGAAHAKRLAGFTALCIQGMIWLTLPVLVPLQWISSKLGGGHATAVTRAEVAITAQLGQDAGVLKPQELHVIRNLLRLSQVTLQDIMTPRPVVFMLGQDQRVEEVLAEHGRLRFSRIPIHAGDADQITGHVTRHDILNAQHEGGADQTMAQLAKPLAEAPPDQNVADTLDQMINRQQHILRVCDEFGGTAGLVTLEDCIETLLGVEIVDETDTAQDMRQAARSLAQRRLNKTETKK